MSDGWHVGMPLVVAEATATNEETAGGIIEINLSEINCAATDPDSIREKFSNSVIHDYSKIRIEEPITLAESEISELHNTIIDGKYRFFAAQKRGETTIRARYFPIADENQAYIKRLELNSRHGRQLTRGEKHKAIPRLHGMGLSQVEIASILGLSQSTISKFLRRENDRVEQAETEDMNIHIDSAKSDTLRAIKLIHDSLKKFKRADWRPSVIQSMSSLIAWLRENDVTIRSEETTDTPAAPARIFEIDLEDAVITETSVS